MTPPQAIKNWFDEYLDAGLELPDGWYGRPFDNMHRLASVSENGEEVRLALDGQELILLFRSLTRVHRNGNDLVLGPFDELTFTHTQSGSTKRYCVGEVRLRALPL